MDSIQGKASMFIGKNLIFVLVLLLLTTFSAHAFESMKAEAQNDSITLKIKKYYSLRKPIEPPPVLFNKAEKHNHNLISSLIRANPAQLLATNTNQELKASKETVSITEVIRTAQLATSDKVQENADISLFIALINPEPMEEFLKEVYSSSRQKVVTDMAQELILTQEIRNGSFDVVAMKEHSFFSKNITGEIREQMILQHELLAELPSIPENEYVSNLPSIIKPKQHQKPASMVAILSVP